MHLTNFRAIYCSGLFIPDPNMVTSLSLLFEKVYLPNHIEVLREFVKHYKVSPQTNNGRLVETLESSLTVTSNDGGVDDPFEGLDSEQRATVNNYLACALTFAQRNEPLFGDIFESDAIHNTDFKVEVLKQDAPGELNTYSVNLKGSTTLTDDPFEGRFSQLVQSGYVPIVGRIHGHEPILGKVGERDAKQLAALLAMKSIELVLPQTRAANPEDILEAREQLKDQLPPFWSTMLKLSVDLRRRLPECKSGEELAREINDLVDTLVRPALIDLTQKLEKERKERFYKILSPLQKGIRLLVGIPPLTQQELITSALVLASDACMNVAENMRVIEALKGEAGLTYLLDLSSSFGSNEKET